MKIYNTHKEVEKDVVNWILKVDDNIKFTFDLKMDIDIIAHNIYAKNIDANNIHVMIIKADNINIIDIKAYDIYANYIKANDIKADDIYIINIEANNIDANDIKTNDINAYNINVNKIDANDINYYAICIAYKTIKCKSIKGRRKNSKHICLDWEIEIIKK